MSVMHRVVRVDPNGAGWAVFDGYDQKVLERTQTKEQAVEAATQELLHEPIGGRLRVHDAHGQLESDRAIAPPLNDPAAARQASPASPDISETARNIAREGKLVDKGLDATDWIVTVLGALGAPIGALLNPNLQEAAGAGWVALTFATFTWTVGCAFAVVVIRKSGLIGFPQVLWVSLSYAGALLLASGIGAGVLDISNAQTGLGPFNFIATIIAAALSAYGPVGLLLCGGIGTWLGFRLSTHFDEGFLA